MRLQADHDIHCHTRLSVCSKDENTNPEALLRWAEQSGYDCLCLTDHYWEDGVPGPNNFYARQGLEHVKESLPLPKAPKGMRMLFGCETEYCGKDRLAITKRTLDEFAFVIVPLNHVHMEGLTRDPSVRTPKQVAELFMQRIEELSWLDLPWKKIGLAHLNCSLIYTAGDWLEVMRLLDVERLRPTFARYAKLGAGIELNASCFKPGWEEHEEENLRLFRLAREEGCRFYCGSDAHHPAELPAVQGYLPEVIERLGLTDSERFLIP